MSKQCPRVSIADALQRMRNGDWLVIDDPLRADAVNDPAQDVVVNDARAAFALPPIKDGHLTLAAYARKHNPGVAQWWETIAPPTCAKCRKPVTSIACERDILRQTHVLTVRCHGAVEMIELTDLEVEEFVLGMHFGEAFSGGDVRGALPAAQTTKA